jgi:PAS domain-containing protein
MNMLRDWLLDSRAFMPHGMCYMWQPDVLWLNVGSDLLIGASYFTILAVLYYFVRERRAELPYWWIPALFAAFIFLCGATHFFDVWTVWNPDYRLEGLVKLATGIVSATTAVALVRVMPQAMTLRTPVQLQQEIDTATAELAMVNAQLRREIAAREGTEAALRDRYETLRLAVQGGRMGAWVRHVQDNSVEWGSEFEAIFELVHPADRDNVAQAVERAIVTRFDYVVEFRFRHASGEWR